MADKQNYKTATLLSAFYVVQVGSLININVQNSAITSGIPYNWVYINSNVIFNNVITKVWFTYIVMYVPSFTEQLSTYTGKYDLYLNSVYASTVGLLPIATNFDAPSIYSDRID